MMQNTLQIIKAPCLLQISGLWSDGGKFKIKFKAAYCSELSKTSLHASEGGMKIATFAQLHLRFLTETTGDIPGRDKHQNPPT